MPTPEHEEAHLLPKFVLGNFIKSHTLMKKLHTHIHCLSPFTSRNERTVAVYVHVYNVPVSEKDRLSPYS